MKYTFHSLLLAFSLLAVPAAASAAVCNGVEMKDSITLDSQTLVLNGMGLRLATFLKVKVYVAGLYVPAKSTQAKALLEADQPWRLVLSFVRSVDRDDMVKAWKEGFADNAKSLLATLKDRIQTLDGAMEDLKDGDTLIFSYTPGKGTSVEVKGNPKAMIKGADFASALLSIWLGNPPNDEVKRGLLGGKC